MYISANSQCSVTFAILLNEVGFSAKVSRNPFF